jgi:hypothetical protein
MAMVCPQCHRTFEQRLHCPGCGERLLYQPSPHRHRSRLEDETRVERTPWGTFAIGLLLAQGLYFALRQLLTAGVLVGWQQESANVWATLGCLLLLQVFQGVSVFAGGVLTGAGQRRGIMFGAAVGIWSGVLFVLIRHWTGQQPVAVSVFGEPILEAAFGGLGGLVGSSIWKPMAAAPLPLSLRQPNRPVLPLRRTEGAAFAGPVAWGRVLTGITLAIGGVVWSDIIRELILEASNGKLKIDTSIQAQLVTWEIGALALIAGGALAGATTLNGLTQGLWVGVGSSVILFGIRLANSALSFQLIVLTVVSSVALPLAGGWFGSQLLPPVSAPRRRKRLLHTG